jgi:hypothetical protein
MHIYFLFCPPNPVILAHGKLSVSFVVGMQTNNSNNITEPLCAATVALVLMKGSAGLDIGVRIGFQSSEGVYWMNGKRNGTDP